MEDWTQFIKSLIRPFIIVWGITIYGICILSGMEVPSLLAGLVSMVIIEYFGERAIKRFQEK
jgi:L-lactate permease